MHTFDQNSTKNINALHRIHYSSQVHVKHVNRFTDCCQWFPSSLSIIKFWIPRQDPISLLSIQFVPALLQLRQNTPKKLSRFVIPSHKSKFPLVVIVNVMSYQALSALMSHCSQIHLQALQIKINIYGSEQCHECSEDYFAEVGIISRPTVRSHLSLTNSHSSLCSAPSWKYHSKRPAALPTKTVTTNASDEKWE